MFEQAGYRARVEKRAWGPETRALETKLVARSPLCASDVVVTITSVANMIAPEAVNGQAIAPVFAFGEWTSATPSRFRVFGELVRIRARAVFRRDGSVLSNPAVLVIDDPSACLAVATPAIAEIWR